MNYEQMNMADESQEYRDFVEKFKPKKTTDDCYTPPDIYAVVLNWCVEKYGVDPAKVLRPFYPGGDYERAEYPEGCVVVDNPPFSILTKILQFYESRGIRYFLFAPYLTILGVRCEGTKLVTGSKIEYTNGARVHSSFITNLEPPEVLARAEPELARRIDEAVAALRERERKKLPVYSYPDCVLTSAMLGYMAEHGTPFTVMKKDAAFIRALDHQREKKKGLYGSGYLLSDRAAAEKAAAEKAAAEKAAAEKAAAEKAAAEKAAAEKAAAYRWRISDREKDIVRQLNESASSESDEGNRRFLFCK